jgi:hypothetical protein
MPLRGPSDLGTPNALNARGLSHGDGYPSCCLSCLKLPQVYL